MKTSRVLLCPILSIVMLLVLAAPSAWADPVVVARMQSLDDVDTMLSPFGTGIDDALTQVGDRLGIDDATWLDRSRPLAIALEQDLMLMGDKGIVVALPVTSRAAATLVLGEAGFESGENGLFSREFPDGTTYIAVLDDYLLSSKLPAAITNFDLQAVIDTADLPPGPISVDVDLAALAPMIQMGLASGRAMMEQQLQQQAERDADEDGPAVDAQAMIGFAGLYLDMVRDVVANTDRLQISGELSDGHVILHKRLVPKAATTLAGLVQAQSPGATDFSRFVAQDDAFVTGVGRFRATDAFVDAMTGFAERYASALELVLASAGPDGAEVDFGALIELVLPQIERSRACTDGGFAMSARVDDEGGFRSMNIAEVKNADACRAMLAETAQMIGALGDQSGFELSATEDALRYRGVRAMRQSFTFPAETFSESEPEIGAMLERIYGGDGIVSFSGLSGKYMVTTTGADAEGDFRTLVDRVKDRSGKRPDRGAFAPLDAESGIVAAVKFAPLMGIVAEQAGEAIPAFWLSDDARVVYGVRFDSSSLTVDLALPLALFDQLRESEDHAGHADHDEP